MQIRTWFFRIVIMFLSVVITSCFSIGKDFPSQTQWMKKNETIREDVKNLLGEPYSIGNSGGVQVWSYVYHNYSLWNKNNYKELKIYWNINDTVKHFYFNSSFSHDVRMGSAVTSKK
jgi:outer membrane protein assembly factor BamE (lipoprotein component of BamABCDE complex)